MPKVEKNWLEWLVFGSSLLLVLTVIGLLAHQALHNENQPPDMVVTLGIPRKSAQGFAVPVSVTNLGNQTAQQVGINVRVGEPLNESSDLEFDFIAHDEKRQGWVMFSGSVTEIPVSARVTGYVVK